MMKLMKYTFWDKKLFYNDMMKKIKRKLFKNLFSVIEILKL